MAAIRILCLGKLPQDLLIDLHTVGHVITIDRDQTLGEVELCAHLKDADVLLSEPQDTLYQSALDQASRLKLIAQRAVGYDNIPLDDVTKRSILVTNTPGVLDNATADLAFGLLLACARRIPEADRYIREGHWQGFQSDLMLGAEISGKTLGLVGMGRIALAMARRARGFDLNVIYCRKPQKRAAAAPSGSATDNSVIPYEAVALDAKDKELTKTLSARRVSLDELLNESDFVSLHCPLNADTRELIGARELALMKTGSILINTGRGKLLDELALIEALQSGSIRGAGLDVFYNEPEVPQALLEAPNAVLTPHIGSASQETRHAMAKLATDSVLAAFSGKLPPNALNGQIFDHWVKNLV